MHPNRPLQLVAFAAAALYFELAIIRFTGAEVLYLAYFSNFILITAFVGLSVGFLSVRRKLELDNVIPFTLLFLFALVLASEFDVNILRNHFGLFFFGNVSGRTGLPGAVLMVVLFIAAAAFFCAVGARVGRAFAGFTPLQAYGYDIFGSLIGIVLFTIQSFVAAGPVIWVITGLLLLGVGHLAGAGPGALRQVRNLLLAGACVGVLLLSSDRGDLTVWSTYQKLTLSEQRGTGLKVVYANGIVHQFMHPLESIRDTYYQLPYRLARSSGLELDKVLIIGAGTGTDVAAALAGGAKAVDAVEIDGRIVEWGRRFHPDAPYQDERVETFVTDGRKFLHDAASKYDLVVFALPDSLMRISPMSDIRLESYLFTLEAFASVRDHLREGGIFVLYNQYRWDWLVHKIAAGIESVFQRDPLIITQGPTTLIAVGNRLAGTASGRSGFERLATDDWPFPYMQRPAVHWLYLGMIGLFLLSAGAAVHFLAPRGTLRHPDYAFFFMGAAFLLLETKSLAFFSLLFGTTWLVNSLAFAGILTSVLIANLIVMKSGLRGRRAIYLMLFITLAVAYFVPARVFLEIDPAAVRYAAAVIFTFAPIFFANLVFSREFRDADESTRAFGWNLMGAVAGGGLEYLSLLTGYRNLLWIVAFCYLMVIVTRRIRPQPAGLPSRFTPGPAA